MFCDAGEYNELASLLFVPGEEAIRLLFHFRGSFSTAGLAAFTAAYFALLCVTYGISVPSGVFIPALLVGSGLGRQYGGQAMIRLDPGAEGEWAKVYGWISYTLAWSERADGSLSTMAFSVNHWVSGKPIPMLAMSR